MRRNLPFDLAVDLFLDHLRAERHLSEKTVSAYARDIVGFVQLAEGQGLAAVDDLRGVHVSRWLQQLGQQGFMAASQARALSAVRGWLGYLHEQGHLSANPAAEIQGPRATTSHAFHRGASRTSDTPLVFHQYGVYAGNSTAFGSRLTRPALIHAGAAGR